MATLLSTNLAAAIVSLDGVKMGRTAISATETPDQLVAQMRAAGLGQLAQQLHDAWIRVRAILDQASTTVTNAKL